jgi:hypothetical protein
VTLCCRCNGATLFAQRDGMDFRPPGARNDDAVHRLRGRQRFCPQMIVAHVVAPEHLCEAPNVFANGDSKRNNIPAHGADGFGSAR